jgi:hypothetical protein
MREFFRGWRRKVGCVTLVMACGCTVLWTRSFIHLDQISVSDSIRSDNLTSRDGGLRWRCLEKVGTPEKERGSRSWSAYSEPLAIIPGPEVLFERWKDARGTEFHRMWNFCGIDIREFRWTEPERSRYRAALLPYWSITIPLMFLSAYLILWKPRKRA